MGGDEAGQWGETVCPILTGVTADKSKTHEYTDKRTLARGST